MEKEFISYEQALALKELGFNESIGFSYMKFNCEGISNGTFNKVVPNYLYPSYELILNAPLYQQAFRWFRDVHMIRGVVEHANSNGSTTYNIWKWNFDNNIGKWERISPITTYDQWEKAELACLIKMIELVKAKVSC